MLAIKKIGCAFFSLMICCGHVGCATKAADALNPFAEQSDTELGDRSFNAILDQGAENGKSEQARRALEAMASYKSALPPQPYYPVVNPPEIRLMWVPDHLNKAGDLVPAHYYYLRVRDSYWAVQDAFEIDEQLNKGSSTGGSATPWVVKAR